MKKKTDFDTSTVVLAEAVAVEVGVLLEEVCADKIICAPR